MSTTKEYFEFITEQLSDIDGFSSRAMMGEYVLYCRGKVFGGIYDDRFLVKPTPSARALMPEAATEIPYPGGSPMLLVDNVEDRAFLRGLVEAMFPELPAPKAKKKGQ